MQRTFSGGELTNEVTSLPSFSRNFRAWNAKIGYYTDFITCTRSPSAIRGRGCVNETCGDARTSATRSPFARRAAAAGLTDRAGAPARQPFINNIFFGGRCIVKGNRRRHWREDGYLTVQGTTNGFGRKLWWIL